MTRTPVEWTERRDQALRDLIDLERQVDAGELSPEVAGRLRQRYEVDAARTLAASAEAVPPGSGGHDPAAAEAAAAHDKSRRRLWRTALYAFGLAAVAAAVLLVPKFVGDRPANGFVTGNEVMNQPGMKVTPTAGRDLASVSDAEMEKVVQANPNVIGMRLALAARYTEKSRYDLATVHYTTVLKQDPNNTEAQSHLGWILLQIGRPKEAAKYVDAALTTDPKLLDALWFRANIRLLGLRDAKGALTTLNQMRAHKDLSPQVRRQVQQLRAAALETLQVNR